jgi:hypothetical protein
MAFLCSYKIQLKRNQNSLCNKTRNPRDIIEISQITGHCCGFVPVCQADEECFRFPWALILYRIHSATRDHTQLNHT